MAVAFLTDTPKKLLSDFDARIEQKEEKEKITTWEKSDDGKYYTHKAKEWSKKAWFKPNIGTDRLTFNIIKSKSTNVSTTVYGYYHGHLIETFLNHFDTQFSVGRATAQPTTDDHCK